MGDKTKPTQTVKLPSDEILNQMLVNEAKKLELQEKRFILEESNQQRQYDYACQSLKVQQDLLKTQPQEQRKTFTRIAVVGIIIVLIVLTFFSYCLYMQKEQIVIDIVKYLGLAFISFIGGMYYGKSNTTSKTDSTYYESAT